MEWQPIETAPKDGTLVLVFVPAEYPEADDPAMVTAVYFGQKWGWETTIKNDNGDPYPVEGKPTYWQPLPDPPRAHAPTPPDTPVKDA
jgi:hypothetical protein